MPLISESRVLIMASDGFEEWELFGPREILQNIGFDQPHELVRRMLPQLIEQRDQVFGRTIEVSLFQ